MKCRILSWKRVPWRDGQPYVPDKRGEFREKIEVLLEAGLRKKRLCIYERMLPHHKGYILATTGKARDNEGEPVGKDFMTDNKGIYTMACYWRRGHHYLPLAELKRRMRDSSLKWEERQDGHHLIRLAEQDWRLIRDNQLNEPLVCKMVEAWAICREPEDL